MADRAIDRIIAHWKSTKGRRGRAEGFGGLEIHWGPWTLGDQDAIYGPFTAAGGGVVIRPAFYARVLVVKAEDAQGNRLFADLDENELLVEADPREVMRLGLLIVGDLNATSEAARDEGDPNPNA